MEEGSKEEAYQAGGAEGEKGTQRDRGRTVWGGDGRYSKRRGRAKEGRPHCPLQPPERRLQ